MEDQPSLMTTEIMLSRMRDYGVIGVSQTASLIMGGVFATAAVTFIEILQGHDALPVRVTGWLLGVTASLQVFDSLVRRSVLEARPTFHAIPLIGAAGLISMVGFALLGPQAGGAEGRRHSPLVLLIAGILFGRSWGSKLADHIEPALQLLYEHHAERTRRRWRLAWPFLIGAIVSFMLAMIDKYANVPLQWPIAFADLALCLFYLFSMLRAHRHIARLYDMAFSAHAREAAARWRQAPLTGGRALAGGIALQSSSFRRTPPTRGAEGISALGVFDAAVSGGLMKLHAYHRIPLEVGA